MISNISFIPSPNHQRKSSIQRIKHRPRFYFTRGPIGCPMQAYCCRHLAMLHKPLHFCQAFTATKWDYKPSNLQPFDSDSVQIKIDNCASKCITNSLGDIQISPEPLSLNITGVGGNIPCTHIGTVNWTIEDDQGMNHTFIIPGTIYAPQAPHHLLSPQHWSQAANDNHPTTNSTWCATYSDHIILYWSQCNYKRTISLDRSTNTATLYSAAGFTAATALCNNLIDLKSPNLTTHHYRVATIFVDSYSDFTFIWNQTSTNAKQTLEAKNAFERFASANNVHIQHYHADNGRFAEPTSVNDINSKGQTISFSGVGAHHQNGVAERRIRDLQDGARAMLIHAYRRWPNAISVNLWPYALRNATDIRNATTNEKGNMTPVAAKLTSFHPFGCPVYVLDARMQSRQKIPKWEERTRIGINLCMSPSHAQSVTLVLNLLTGLFSPQYHVLHDDRFETVGDALIPKSKWQQLAKFQSNTPQASKVSEGNGFLPDENLQSFQQPMQELDTNLEINRYFR